MSYNYEKEKQNIDNVMLASITATAQTLLDTAGSFTFPYVTREIRGKLWSMIACVDYLVEIGFIREITNKDILAERVFIKGVKKMKRVLTVLVMLLIVTGVFAGDWYPYAQEDKITDITSLALIYVDEEQPNAMFSVLFSNGLTRFAIITNEYFSDRDNNITYRFDKEEPVNIKGLIGTGNVTVVFDSKTFLDDLKTHSQLILRLKPYNEPYLDIIIDLTNFNNVYKMSEPVIELIVGKIMGGRNMNKDIKESIRNDIRLPKHEKLNCIVRTIREWDDDDCDFFHTEQFCEELIKQYCEDEHNKCKARSWFINLLFTPVRLFQSAYDVFYNSKDK